MTDKPYMKYRVDDLELLEYIWDKFQQALKSNLVGRARARNHYEWNLDWPGKHPWWENKPEVAEKLKALTYPFNEPIMTCWVKYYTPGEYMSLHTDDVKVSPSWKPYESAWTNSILLNQSSDIEGGDIVLAGDGWEQSMEGIRKRLITMRHHRIGDTITWDNEIVHGISQIEKGYRAVMIVVKERK